MDTIFSSTTENKSYGKPNYFPLFLLKHIKKLKKIKRYDEIGDIDETMYQLIHPRLVKCY